MEIEKMREKIEEKVLENVQLKKQLDDINEELEIEKLRSFKCEKKLNEQISFSKEDELTKHRDIERCEESSFCLVKTLENEKFEMLKKLFYLFCVPY